MEDCVVDKSVNNDVSLQSYSQGLERITGTRNNTTNFQIPKGVLEVRETSWNNLFDKYSENMSDEIELNLNTLEPEEEEEEVSEEEYSCGQRVPMRKPATLVQYWIDTGNLLNKTLLDKNESSESGSSLSEKEITPPLHPPFSNEETGDGKQKHKSDSSCSSVDTAAYILSIGNITKKADTIAIIEDTKHTCVESSKNVSIKNTETLCNDKIKYIGTVSIDKIAHNDNNNVNTNTVLDTALCSMSMALRKDGQLSTSIVVPANTVQFNMSSENSSCDEIDKIAVLNTSQSSLDVQNINDIVSISQQFDKQSKRFPANGKNNDKDQSDISDKHFNKEEMSVNTIAEETTAKDTNLTQLQRKKLYTGRDSPVDLILFERNSINKPSKAKLCLHPALDNAADSIIKRKTSLIHKEKKKRRLPSGKKSLKFKKIKQPKKKRKKSFSEDTTDSSDVSYEDVSISDEDITNITDEVQLTNSDRSYDSITNRFSKSLSNSHDDLDRRNNDILLREYSNADIHIKDKVCTQDLTSLNLNPVVLLERIMPSSKTYESKSIKNTENTQRNNMRNYSNISEKLHYCEIEDLDLEPIDSDDSTILICECKKTTRKYSSPLSDSSSHPRLNIKDESSLSNAGKENNKLSNFKDIGMNQNKKPRVVLERLQLTNKNYINTTVKSQFLNMNGTRHSSNSYGIGKTNNIKFREPIVVLERLPENICFKRSNGITYKNISAGKKEISQDICTSFYTNKRKSEIVTKTPTRINVRTSAPTIHKTNNNYSLRTHTKSKKNDDKVSYMSDTVAKYENRVFGGALMTNSVLQHENRNNQTNRDKHNKYSILSFISSDEDDFLHLIQPPRKRSKVSIDDRAIDKTNTVEKNVYNETKLISTNKNKYYNKNLSTINLSSKKVKSREINGSIKDKKEQDEVEKNSFDSDITLSTFLQARKNKIYSFSSSGNDSNSTAEDLDKRKKIYSSLNCSKTMNNNSEKSSDTAIKRNEGDRKNDVILFQTKTYYTDSSDPEESNNNSEPTRKTLRKSIRHDSRSHNHIHREKFFNDSFAKKSIRKQSTSLNSSVEKCNVENRAHNVRNRSRSASRKEANISERFINKEFNDNLNLNTSNATKDMPHSPVTNGIQDIFKQTEDNAPLNGFLGENNVSRSSKNKLLSEKSNFKRSLVTQQHNVKSTVKKLLTFQTKTFYDSDSSESS